MGETKHTPGPWEACDQGDYGDFDGASRVILGDDHRIAVVHDDGEGDGEANASLIAAAPDLLKSESKLAAEVGGLKAFEHEVRAAIGNTNWNVLMQRLDEADAAIARAEGRSE